METEKIDLQWPKFTLQLATSAGALLCSVIATKKILPASQTGSTGFAVLLAGALILIPFFVGALLMRVPYRTDEFERRLRNWAMTQSAIVVLISAVSANLVAEAYQSYPLPISPYIMPAMFLICYVAYSQFLRLRIAQGKRNGFTDG